MTCKNALKGWQPYFLKVGFENLYLEDSFVLGIERLEEGICIRMEFVLTEDHPRYSVPKPGEQYCYRTGKIKFSDIRCIKTFHFKKVLYQDANLDQDMGNIDVFLWCGDEYVLSGDWGELDVVSGTLEVSFNEN